MGARMVDEETIRRWISEGIANNPGGSSYLSYVALVGQVGSAIPDTRHGYQNDFTGLAFGRIGAGQYYIGAIGQFTINKTISPPFGDGNGVGTVYLPILNGASLVIGYYTIYTANDGDYMNFTVVDTNGVTTELSSLIGNNGTLYIEIRVYP